MFEDVCSVIKDKDLAEKFKDFLLLCNSSIADSYDGDDKEDFIKFLDFVVNDDTERMVKLYVDFWGEDKLERLLEMHEEYSEEIKKAIHFQLNILTPFLEEKAIEWFNKTEDDKIENTPSYSSFSELEEYVWDTRK